MVLKCSYGKQPVINIPTDTAPGKRIVYGFSYTQRINRGATSEVWFAPGLAEDIERRLLMGDGNVLQEFGVDWAAVYQYEILQDYHHTLPMFVDHFYLTYYFLKHMRAGGLRVVVIIMGKYTDPSHGDELEIMDQRVKEAIARTLNTIYLEEESANASRDMDELREQDLWRAADALPHVFMALGAKVLFRPARATSTTTNFFKILDMLPQKHIQHEVRMHLQLPDLSDQHREKKIRAAEFTLGSFQMTMNTVFRGMDMWSIGGLHERPGAGSEIMPTINHAKGYGDRTSTDFAKESARELATYMNVRANPSYGAGDSTS